MYRISKELDLSPIIGKPTTQIRVGQFDLQFTFGDLEFAVSSPVKLFQRGDLIGNWEGSKWPDAAFYDIMNTEITRAEVKTDSLIVISFANGIDMHLVDDSDQYECMQIHLKGNQNGWII
jgi:hypothetical protein